MSEFAEPKMCSLLQPLMAVMAALPDAMRAANSQNTSTQNTTHEEGQCDAASVRVGLLAAWPAGVPAARHHDSSYLLAAETMCNTLGAQEKATCLLSRIYGEHPTGRVQRKQTPLQGARGEGRAQAISGQE
jgi:hypothetical protein